MPDHQEVVSAFEVEAFVARESEWNPYDLCSDAVTAMLAGGVTSYGAARIDVEREKLAKEVSRALTLHILKSIQTRDLRNGYKQSV